jgi:hypothetical protein
MTKEAQLQAETVVHDKTAFMVRQEHRMLSLVSILSILGVWELIAT